MRTWLRHLVRRVLCRHRSTETTEVAEVGAGWEGVHTERECLRCGKRWRGRTRVWSA